MVTIKDVADRSGVAISTVSKVLNGYPNVSEKTRQAVNDAIQELHYVPNAIAAALSSKTRIRIALVINSVEQSQSIDELDMRYLSGALEEAKKQGLTVRTYFYSMLDDLTADEIIGEFQSLGIGAVVFFGFNKDDNVLKEVVYRKCFKTVVVDSPIAEDGISSVWIDQKQAQFEVAEATLPQVSGDRVLYIAGKKNAYVTEGRIQGIKEFATKHKLNLKVEYADFSERKAREITFREGNDTDMIACASDLMAIGAMFALKEMDVYHPICGFDGIGLMSYAAQKMHTVKQDFSGIAAEAVREAVRLLQGEEGRNIILPHELATPVYEDVLRREEEWGKNTL